MTFKHPPTLSFHEASGHLSRRLPGGRVHIERYLPFVLLHRSPEDGNDLGTLAAAYVLITAVLAPIATRYADRLTEIRFVRRRQPAAI